MAFDKLRGKRFSAANEAAVPASDEASVTVGGVNPISGTDTQLRDRTVKGVRECSGEQESAAEI